MADLEPVEYGIFWGKSLFEGLGSKTPIIEHIFYKNDTICISAETGVGKTVLILQIIAALTSGKPFLDTFQIPKPHTVLYLQTEGDRVETMDRLISMSKGVSIDHDKWVHLNMDGVCLNTDEGYKTFIELARKPGIKYDVVIIDPLYTTVKGSISQDDVVNDWIRQTRKIRKEFGCSYIIVHHESIKPLYSGNKKIERSSKDLMGSSFWGNNVTYNYKLELDKKTGLHRFYSGKERNRYIIDSITLRMLEPEPLMYILEDGDMTPKQVQILKILEESLTPISPEVLKRMTDVSRATVFRALDKLIEQQKVEKVKSGSSIKYAWRKTPPLPVT